MLFSPHPIQNSWIVIVAAFLLGWGGLGPSTLQAQPGSTGKRVLFVGNSYTFGNNLPNLFDQLAQSGGDTLVVQSSTQGGARFVTHLNAFGNFPNTLNTLRQGNWDYVILQNQSQVPVVPYWYPWEHLNPGRQLVDSIRKYNPCAQTLAFQTWGRRFGGQQCLPDAQGVQHCSVNFTDFDHMTDSLEVAYRALADSTNSMVAPVGRAWMAAIDSGYVLHTGDNSHPNLNGSYLAACVFYSAILQKSPVGLSYTAGLSAADAQRLQTIAYRATFDSLSHWFIDTGRVVLAPQVLNQDTVCGTNSALQVRVPTVGGAQGPLSYTWTPSKPDTKAVTFSTGSGPTFSFSLVVQDSVGNCLLYRDTIQRSGNLSLAIQTPADTLCFGQTAALAAQGNANSWQWSTGQTGSSIAPAIAPGDTTFSLTGFSPGCTTTVSKNLYGMPDPDSLRLQITDPQSGASDSTFCAGDSVEAQVTSIPGILLRTQLQGGWNVPVPPSAVGLSTGIKFPTDTTTYIYSLTTTQGCSYQASATAYVENGADIRLTGPTTPFFCAGDSVTLSAAGGGGYTWPDGSTTAANTWSARLFSDTTLVVSASTPNFGCPGQDSVVLTALQPTSLLVTASSTTVCQGQPVNVLAQSSAPQVSWSTGDTGSAQTFLITQDTTFTATASSPGACSATDSVRITAQPTPSVAIRTDSATCTGSQLWLYAQGAADNWLWANGSAADSIPWTATNDSTFVLRGTNTNGCSDTDTFTVRVAAQLPVQITGPNQICAGDTVNLTATGAATYTWSTGAVGPNLQLIPTADLDIVVEGANAAGCSGADTLELDVVSPPVLQLQATDTTACPGQSKTIRVFGANSYVWNSGQTGGVRTFTLLQDTLLTVVGADIFGCTDTLSQQFITQPTPPGFTLSLSRSPVCPGDSVTAIATGADSYRWNTGDTTPSLILQPLRTLELRVTASQQGFQCPAIDSITVTVHPAPDTPAVSRQGDSLISTDNGQPLQWFRGGEPLPGADTWWLLPNQPGGYYVVRTNPQGCSSFSNTVVYTPNSLSEAFVNSLELELLPTAWRLSGFQQPLQLRVYNALGQLLYTHPCAPNQPCSFSRAGTAGGFLRVLGASGQFGTRRIPLFSDK